MSRVRNAEGGGTGDVEWTGNGRRSNRDRWRKRTAGRFIRGSKQATASRQATNQQSLLQDGLVMWTPASVATGAYFFSNSPIVKSSNCSGCSSVKYQSHPSPGRISPWTSHTPSASFH